MSPSVPPRIPRPGRLSGQETDYFNGLLAKQWKAFTAKLRKRGWECDLMGCGPLWVANKRARDALGPLLGRTVEFLPIHSQPEMDLCVLHPLVCIPLDERAVTNSESATEVFTAIRTYSFSIADLEGKPIFTIEQSPLSNSALEGIPYLHATCVSDEFVKVFERCQLRGAVFRKVFSITESGGELVFDDF